jgi:hypothetical protein
MKFVVLTLDYDGPDALSSSMNLSELSVLPGAESSARGRRNYVVFPECRLTFIRNPFWWLTTFQKHRISPFGMAWLSRVTSARNCASRMWCPLSFTKTPSDFKINKIR